VNGIKDNINLYLSRILSGFYYFVYNKKRYKLVYPDISIKYEAELYAQEQYDLNKFNDWIIEEDILHYLVMSGLWEYAHEDLLKKLEKQIEDHKVDLFQSFLNPNKLKAIRRNLENTRKRYEMMFSVRHSFDHLTALGYSNIIKNQYIISYSIYDDKNNLIFDINQQEIDLNLLNNIIEFLSNNTIDIKTFRKIARSDSWRNYWSANKDKLFDKPTVNWTDEQRTLVILTKMYDSAYESVECPPEHIFDDDDMFDGWMISQRRENDKIRSKNRSEKMFGSKGLSKAQEVFLVANSQEEAQAIYDLNDVSSRNIIKERNKFIQGSSDSIPEAKLPDVQRNIIMQQNKNFIKSHKG
jgi:hypothetical protein